MVPTRVVPAAVIHEPQDVKVFFQTLGMNTGAPWACHNSNVLEVPDDKGPFTGPVGTSTDAVQICGTGCHGLKVLEHEGELL